MKMRDVAIIGGGPAGMTAGIYCARKQLDVIMLTENIGGQTLWSSAVENYLGFEYISGTALVDKFEDHLKKFPIEIIFKQVTKVIPANPGYELTDHDGETYRARAVIVASGKVPRELDVPGESDYRGKGITYCATCDAPLFSGRDVVVVGGGNSGLGAAIQLLSIASKIYVVEFEPKLLADEAFQTKIRGAAKAEILTNTQVTTITGDTMVTAATVKNRSTGEERVLAAQGIFVEIGLNPNSSCVSGLVEMNKAMEVKVDNAGRTQRAGVFAAGDVTDVPEKQIIVAAGEGAKAALSAYDYLIREE